MKSQTFKESTLFFSICLFAPWMTFAQLPAPDTLYYDYGYSSLNFAALEALRTSIDQLQASKKYCQFEITAHCDSIETAEYQLRLALRRALVARSYLMALGIDSNQINIASFHDSGFDPPFSKDVSYVMINSNPIAYRDQP